MELATTQKVSKVQIARRMCCWAQGNEIEIRVGSEPGWDHTQPKCVNQIMRLTKREGLQDYECKRNPRGKFVNIVKPNGGALSLCEVKVFGMPGVAGKRQFSYT